MSIKPNLKTVLRKGEEGYIEKQILGLTFVREETLAAFAEAVAAIDSSDQKKIGVCTDYLPARWPERGPSH